MNDAPLAMLLRHFRKRTGLTQAALASRAYVSARTVGDIENGAQLRPRPDTIDALARALELSADEGSALTRAAGAMAGGSRRGSLPTHQRAIVGRQREIETIAAAIAGGRSRLSTLIGPAGVGKTRIAIAVAARSKQGPVVFVDLAPVTDPRSALPTIAFALGAHGRGDVAERIVAAFTARPALVVLDNCEHVADGLVRLGEIIAAAPGGTILATSREPLRLDGEQRWQIQPMSEAEAVALFADRACANDPAFAVDRANERIIGAICDRLNRLPLAIVLAAAQTGVSTPSALLARLDRPLDVLHATARDVPKRHLTMRDAIAWTHRLLAPRERELFAVLGLAREGISAQSVGRILDDTNPTAVAARLRVLVERQFLEIDDRSGEPRYRMTYVVAEFAREQFAALDDRARFEASFARAYLARAQALHTALRAPSDDDAHVESIGREIENYRAALQILIAARCFDEAARLINATFRYWRHSGSLDQLRPFYVDLLPEPALTPATRHRVAVNLAIIEFGLERHTAALALCQSVIVDRDEQDADVLVNAYSLACTTREILGDPAGAKAMMDRAIALLDRCGSYRQIATLNNYALHKNDRGEPDAAIAACREAVRIGRAIGVDGMNSEGMFVFARTLLENGLYDEALVSFETALSGFARRNHTRFVCVVRNFIGFIHLLRDDDTRAIDAFLQSFAQSRQANFRELFAEALDGLASTRTARGRGAAALRLISAAHRLRSELGLSRVPLSLARIAQDAERDLRAALDARACVEALKSGDILGAIEPFGSSRWDDAVGDVVEMHGAVPATC